MSYRSKYNPDYAKLYPGVEMSPEMLAAAKKYDRERRRIEYDLKRGAPIYYNNTTGKKTDRYDPDRIEIDEEQGRETSLDALLESGEKAVDALVDEYANPLGLLLKKEKYRQLHRCIALLTFEERRLLDALFWQELPEAEYAKLKGCKQPSVNQMKHRIFAKLRKFLGAN
jgi:DNA-directed RNA polymerase specialized sigma24 family protein